MKTKGITLFFQVYAIGLVQASLAGQVVHQPTAQEMLRAWQAYLSVLNSVLIHPVTRPISVLGPIVQLRLSVIAATFAIVFLAVVITFASYFAEPRDSRGHHIYLPSSHLDWMVQAAREHFPGDRTKGQSPADYAASHGDVRIKVSDGGDGSWTTCIASQHT
jgi:hypothetical protein